MESPITKYDFDMDMAEKIASILGWEWDHGEWQKNGVYQTDYFDPMNDEVTAHKIATELNVDLAQVAREQGKLTVAQAICFHICKKDIGG